MSTASTNKLKVKDIITVVLLALINVVVFFASSLLYATPVTIILMPVFFALLEGVVYFIIGTKVKKPGAILIYSIVRAIMGGYLPYILLFILSGLIAELLLWKMGYGNSKALTISYVINQLLAAFGSTIIPYGGSDGHGRPSGQYPCRVEHPPVMVVGRFGSGCDRRRSHRRCYRQAYSEKALGCIKNKRRK